MRPPIHSFCTLTGGRRRGALCVHCDAFFPIGAHYRLPPCEPLALAKAHPP